MNARTIFETALRQGSAVFVVGTGASVAATSGAAEASWAGLVRHGLATVTKLQLGTAQWASAQTVQLDVALEEGDTDGLISVASAISQRLQQSGPTTYAKWLQETVGQLALRDDALVREIAAFEIPILTTNYDTLLEQGSSRSSVLLTETEAARAVFRRETTAVLHLHGVWTTPSSVVFSQADYAGLLASRPSTFLQSAHYATKTFIYLGYGQGLEDPNFGSMLQLHRDLFPDSATRHIRLARTSEVDLLRAQHANDDIEILAYGTDHATLPIFLRSLRQGVGGNGASTDRIAFARAALQDRMHADAILSDHLGKQGTATRLSGIIPPVLLPLPHEQFATARTVDDDVARPERIQIDAITAADSVVVLVGEELSGLTTALQYLADAASSHRTGTAPLVVDGRELRANRSLSRLIGVAALDARLIDRARDRLPSHIVAIDNFPAQLTRVYDAAIDDVLSSAADHLFIGCRVGEEADLLERLNGHRLPVQVAYLGKLGSIEVRTMAAVLAPHRVDTLGGQVLQVIEREHLPRNPFTISLLLVLFTSTLASSTHNSDTAVLRDYVDLLLGRGGRTVDARWSLDPQNREVVLAHLAKDFVRQRTGSLSQAQALSVISTFFDRVGWQEDPILTLEGFAQMGLLRISTNQVEFRQSSYLHLFAARAAQADEGFLTDLLTEPLLYAPILRHYAALQRNSEMLMQRLRLLLEEWEPAPATGRIFGDVTPVEAPALPSSTPLTADKNTADHAAPETRDEQVPQTPEDDYDASDDRDHAPFPITDPSGWNRSARLAYTLDLVSRALRDSDQLDNLPLKRDLLVELLRGWGYLLEVFEHDSVFDDAVEFLAGAIETVNTGRSDEDPVELRAHLGRVIPAFVVLGGISTCLTSRKLRITLDAVAGTDTVRDDYYAAPVAALLSYDIQGAGWATQLPTLAARWGQKWVVADFVFLIARLTYRYSALAPNDEEALKQFLLERQRLRFRFPDPRTQQKWLSGYRQRIERERLNARRRLNRPNIRPTDEIFGPA